MIDIQAHSLLDRYREGLADGFYETIIEHSLDIIAENDKKRPADVAFYALGEVYAHYDFSDRDLGLSQFYFEKLIQNFPDSPLTPEAKTYISLFENIDAKEQAIALQKARLAYKETVSQHKSKAAPEEPPKKLIENQDFEEAVRKNTEILRSSTNGRHVDTALYNLGLIYAHVNNPAKDYKKSQVYFHELTEKFPDSTYAEEAQIWLGLFETIEKIQQVDEDIEMQRQQLNQ